MSTLVSLGDAWALSPKVSLRPEPFGALAYHFGNRRLTFLKHPELVAVVLGLGECDTVDEALDRAAVPLGHRRAYVGALQSLADCDMIRPRSAVGAP